MLDRFVGAIKTYATTQDVPLITFERGQRKDDVVADYRARRPMDDGVVVIGVAQEKMRAFKAHKRSGPQGGVTFDFSRQSVAVNHYYFYVQDPEWGPAFLKFGTYLPYPIKLCLNGHEWVKQQLRRADVAFDSLDNGFLACADPTRLQAICDQLGPADVQAFFDRWTARLPAPLTATDRAAGYTHRLALQQVEVSLTQVFARPVQGRHFFEAVIRENLDLGRPDRVGLLFPHRITRRDAAAGLGLSHARDHRWRRAQSAYRVQVLARQAVLQRAARVAHRDHDQQPEGLLRRQGRAESVAPRGTWATRSIASSSKSNASVTSAC